jgi:4'-phosphopantetheinyl transferase
VWRANLDAVSGEVTELISGDERARAERILSPSKRERWSRARGVLREVLGRYVDSDPSALHFGSQGRGKPTTEMLNASVRHRRMPLGFAARIQLRAH